MGLKRASTAEKGREGEQLAARWLEGKGFRILERNYRNRLGEIDIVADDGGVIVFIEVRALKASAGHSPEETVGWKKQQRISRTAQAYIQYKRLEDRPARFDVVAVTFDGSRSFLRHIPDAFELREA
jgi:putative endonuclease